MIQAILFDVDGVLVDAKMFSKELEKRYHLNGDKMQPFFGNEFQDCLVGKADLKEKIKPYLKDMGWEKSVEDFVHAWFTTEDLPDQNMLDYVKGLVSKNIPCYLGTNQEHHRTQYIWEKMQFKDIFNDIFSSAIVGFRKPDSKFFTSILDRLKLQPKELLFWDDSVRNVTAAQELGIHAEVFKDRKYFFEKMKEYQF